MKSLSRVWLFAIPWTVAYQAPPSTGFPRQQCWNGLPFPSPGNLPDPGIEPSLLHWRQTLYCLNHQGGLETQTMSFLNTLSLGWSWASFIAQSVKNLPAMQETQVRFLGWEDPLEKEMATHSSILAWRIPWTEEPGRLQSTGCPTKSWTWPSN